MLKTLTCISSLPIFFFFILCRLTALQFAWISHFYTLTHLQWSRSIRRRIWKWDWKKLFMCNYVACIFLIQLWFSFSFTENPWNGIKLSMKEIVRSSLKLVRLVSGWRGIKQKRKKLKTKSSGFFYQIGRTAVARSSIYFKDHRLVGLIIYVYIFVSNFVYLGWPFLQFVYFLMFMCDTVFAIVFLINVLFFLPSLVVFLIFINSLFSVYHLVVLVIIIIVIYNQLWLFCKVTFTLDSFTICCL